MIRLVVLAALLLLVASPAGEPPVVPCGGDLDCQTKNTWICGGAYAPACKGVE